MEQAPSLLLGGLWSSRESKTGKKTPDRHKQTSIPVTLCQKHNFPKPLLPLILEKKSGNNSCPAQLTERLGCENVLAGSLRKPSTAERRLSAPLAMCRSLKS